jgi:hypothetical protein
MPELRACAQILWSNLWITRSWLSPPHVRHGLAPVACFLIKRLVQNRSLINGAALKWCLVRIDIGRGAVLKAFICSALDFS